MMTFDKLDTGYYLASEQGFCVVLDLKSPTKHMNRYYAIEVKDQDGNDALRGVAADDDRYGCTLKEAKERAEVLMAHVLANVEAPENKSYNVKHGLQKECEGLVRDLRKLGPVSLASIVNTLEVHTDVDPEHVVYLQEMAEQFTQMAARLTVYEAKREVAAYLLEEVS